MSLLKSSFQEPSMWIFMDMKGSNNSLKEELMFRLNKITQLKASKVNN